MKPLNELTASEIVSAIKAGEATCEQVTRACLERIAERERSIEAWQYLDRDLAIAQARALDRQRVRGPLYGVRQRIRGSFERAQEEARGMFDRVKQRFDDTIHR